MFKSAHGSVMSHLSDEELQPLVGELQEVLGNGAEVRVHHDELLHGTWIDFAVIIPTAVDGGDDDGFDEKRIRELVKRLSEPNDWRGRSGQLVITDFTQACANSFPNISITDFSHHNMIDATVDVYGHYVEVNPEAFLPYGARVEYD